MFPIAGLNLFKSIKEIRSLTITLVSHSSKKSNWKQEPFQLVDTNKGVKKNQRKRRVIVKRASDDIEALWLENLTSENLKLYRRTSFGSFRKINLENLLEKLKEIYPEKFGDVSAVENSHEESHLNANPSELGSEALVNESNGYSGSVSSSPATERDSSNEKAEPYLSDYVVKHLIEFPLLRTQDNRFSEAVKIEVDDYGNVDSRMFPSVTRILNETMSKASRLKLQQWKDQMIKKLGPEGFLKFEEDLLNQGAKFHSTLKTYLEVSDKNLVKVDPQISGCWQSLEKCLPDISDVQFVEESIYHPVLMYKGIVDCVAAYRGRPCVIEWKKSEKRKPKLMDTHDAPLQLCAYLGALPWHKNVNIENGLVVVAYTDGTPANVFEMSLESCEFYWMEWLRRVQSYWLKKSPTVIQSEG